MKCPHCGGVNADDALVCSMCGARLAEPVDVIDSEVEELMGQLPTVKAQRVEERTRMLSEVLAEETQLIRGDALLGDVISFGDLTPAELQARAEAAELQVPDISADQAEDPDLEETLDEEDFEYEDLDSDDELAAPGVIPVGATELRPAVQQQDEEHFFVRNTRDYDHDAQSVNLAGSAENFETLRQNTPAREGRRDPYARSARRGDVLGEGNSRSKVRPLLALLLVLVVLGAAGGVLTYGMELWGGKRVPGVVGESQATAEALLSDKGFVVNIEAQPADDAIGKVLAQDPELGTRLPEGSEVTVVVAANRTVPEVVGLTEDEAREKLKEAGAERVETEAVQSSEAEGTVLSVKPEVGAAFISRSPVVLTVATPFRVPDVVGKKQSDAVDILKAGGFGVDVTYVNSDATVRTVVSTTPGPGEVIPQHGTVQVMVSSPYPSNPMHLAEFFGHSSQDVDKFLQAKGYSFGKGFVDTYGNALATYTSKDKGNITFSSQPYLRNLTFPKDGSSNVMEQGVPFAGVRMDLAASQIPSGYDEAAIKELIKLCGFDGYYETTTNKNIVVPAGAPKTSAQFIAASGRIDDLIWTVVIVGNNNTRRACALCAKEGMFSSSELAQYGGVVRNFVAYQEAYLSSEFQQKEEKKDDKKDNKKDDKDSEKKEEGDGEQSSDQQG